MSLHQALLVAADSLQGAAAEVQVSPAVAISLLKTYATTLRVLAETAKGTDETLEHMKKVLADMRGFLETVTQRLRHPPPQRERPPQPPPQRKAPAPQTPQEPPAFSPCEGGPADGTMVPGEALGNMPVGAKTVIEGGVYTLQQDRKLRFVETLGTKPAEKGKIVTP